MTIQPLRIVAFPTLVIIVKSIVYRRPYASTSPSLASPVRATSSNFVRSLEASAAANPSAAAKTRALCRPRGLSGLRQYSDNLRMSTIARAPFRKRTRQHYAPSMQAANISRPGERPASAARVLPARRLHAGARWVTLQEFSEGLRGLTIKGFSVIRLDYISTPEGTPQPPQVLRHSTPRNRDLHTATIVQKSTTCEYSLRRVRGLLSCEGRG